MADRNLSTSKQLNERVQIHVKGGKEYWRDVAGYEGYYRVSSWGRVKSLRRKAKNRSGFCWKKARILKQAKYSTGHMYVHLHKNWVGQTITVHRLVLLAFVGPCPEGMEARHFPDRDPSNNHLENLNWGTRKQQYQDRQAHGTSNDITGKRGTDINTAKLTEEEVLEIRRLFATGKYSKAELGRIFGVYPGTILAIVERKSWKHI